MKIEYNKILELYQTRLLGIRIYGESVAEVIGNAINYINFIRESNGLSKICK